MIQNKEFYLTLLSNSSVKYYPKNTANKFVTQLPQRIELHDDMEVALFEIQYPSVANVTKGNNTLSVTYSVKSTEDVRTVMKTIEIKPGYYQSVSAVLQAINSVITTETRELNIFLTEVKSFTKVDHAVDSSISSVIFCDILSLQLGFEPDMNIISVKKSPNMHRLNAGFPKQLYVYCDIFDSHVVGDIFSPLARVISLDMLWHKEKYGSNSALLFNLPMYFPVAKREFSSITIDIRDTFGDPIAFDSEVLSIVLHIRPRR